MILNRDYRSNDERAAIATDCSSFCDTVQIFNRKEIENYLLVPESVDRAARRKVDERAKRTGKTLKYVSCAEDFLAEFAKAKRSYVTAQCLKLRRQFERGRSPHIDEATVNELRLTEVDEAWKNFTDLLPGKEVLSRLNERLQNDYGVSVTATAVIDAMHVDEIPEEISKLVDTLEKFSSKSRRVVTKSNKSVNTDVLCRRFAPSQAAGFLKRYASFKSAARSQCHIFNFGISTDTSISGGFYQRYRGENEAEPQRCWFQ